MHDFPQGATIAGNPKDLSHLLLVAGVLRKLDFAAVVDARIPDHPLRELSTGTCVEALILAILSQTHTLSGLSLLFDSYDTELLLGPGVEPEKLNDNRLGRALDQLFKAGVSGLNTACLLRSLAVYDLDLETIHFDTTSISVHGRYDAATEGNPDDVDAAPAVRRGFSKDHRPDLKQVVYGLSVNCEGVPLVGRVTDGNRSDNLENATMLKRLHEVLPNPTGTTMVADSKLFGGRNLLLADRLNMNLLTLLPKSVNLRNELLAQAGDLTQARVLRARVKEEPSEGELEGRIKVDRRREEATWRGVSLETTYEWKDPETGDVYEIPLQALVVRSSDLEAQKEKAADKKVAAGAKKLKAKEAGFAKQTFKCAEDAEAAAAKVRGENWGFYIVTTRVLEDEVPVKRGRGRPKAGAEAKTEKVWRVEIEGAPCPRLREQWVAEQAAFVLVWLAGYELSDEEALEIYKNQSKVEGAIRWTKVVAEIAPIFLKSTERIAALGLLYVLALQVNALLQRELRKRLEEEGATIPGNPGQGRTAAPTSEVAYRLFSGVRVMPVEIEGKPVKWIFNVTTEVKAVLDLLKNDLLDQAGVGYQVREPQGAERGRKPRPVVAKASQRRGPT